MGGEGQTFGVGVLSTTFDWRTTFRGALKGRREHSCEVMFLRCFPLFVAAVRGQPSIADQH